MKDLREKIKAKSDNLVIYTTAGYPEYDSLPEILGKLESSKVDLIEIGIPFSDSLVDGPTIQACNQIALDNGMTLARIFKQLNSVKSDLSKPIILMGSYNQVLQYGISKFLNDCQENQVRGVILPDLPPEVYQKEYQQDFEAAGIGIVFLITTRTPDSRIKYLDSLSNIFLYLVSMDGVTGQGLKADKSLEDFCSKLVAMNLNNPFLIGFGVNNRESFNYVSKIAAGAIIGSEFLRQIDKGKIESFLASIKN